MVTAASDAQQSLGATETVFGKFSGAVVKDSNAAAKAVGLSGTTYRENANLIGSLFKNQGVATSQLAGKTKGMIKVGADLAATFGGSTTTAVEALGSAFKGEFDSLEKYGISLKQSTVNTEAMKVANVSSTAEFNKLSTAQQTAAKQQATSNLIMKQSKDSTGAFAKESGTLAHQQQVLSAQFDNVKAAVGARLLPVITKFLTYLTTNGPAAVAKFKEFIKPVQEFFNKFKSGSGQASGKLEAFKSTVSTVMESVKSVIDSALVIIQSLWKMFGGTLLSFVSSTFNNILTYIRGVFAVIKGVFDIFAGILTGDWSRVWNGIKSVVTGVGGIIKALVSQLWNVIATVFRLGGTIIKAIFRGLWNALVAVVKGAWSKIKSGVSAGINAAKAAISSGWNAAKSVTTAAWNRIKSAVSSGISKAVSTVKALPGKIKSGLGNLGSLLYNAGKDILQGLIRGIGDMVGKVKDKLSSVTKLIPDWKGPLSYDKVMLRPAGQAIIQGLINGFDDKQRDLRSSLRGTSKMIAGGIDPALGDSSFALGGSGGGATVINVTVTAPVGSSPQDIGRELARYLKEYERAGGKGR